MYNFPRIFPLIRISQFEKDFYIWNVKFSQLKNLYKFSIRSDENINGFNRFTDARKINNIVEFISEAELNTPNYPLFVTPIILGISTDDDKIRLNRSTNETELIISQELEDSFKALVVDWQHRLKGIEKWVGWDFSENDISIPVVFLFDYSEYELAEIFAKVNFTQKPVNKSLYYDIFWASPFMPISEIRIAHILLKDLNEKFEEDFHFRIIKMLQNSEWYVSQWFFGDKLVRLLNKSLLYKEKYQEIEQKYKEFEKDSIQEENIKTSKIYRSIQNDLISFFLTIQDIFWAEWVVYKTNGIWALLLLLEDFHLLWIYEYSEYLSPFEDKNIFNKEEYKSGSESIQKKIYRKISREILFKEELNSFNVKKWSVLDIREYQLKTIKIFDSKNILNINKRLFKILFDEWKIEYQWGWLYKVV